MNATPDTGRGSPARHPFRNDARWRKARSLKIEIALAFGIVIALMLALGLTFYLSAAAFGAKRSTGCSTATAAWPIWLFAASWRMAKAADSQSDFLLSVDQIGVTACARTAFVADAGSPERQRGNTSQAFASSLPTRESRIRSAGSTSKCGNTRKAFSPSPMRLEHLARSNAARVRVEIRRRRAGHRVRARRTCTPRQASAPSKRGMAWSTPPASRDGRLCHRRGRGPVLA